MKELLTFPSELSLLTNIALIALSALTSFITAAFGIGGGVVLIAVLAVLLPPAALIPVHGVVQVGANAGRALIMLKDLKTDILLPFIIGSVIGAGLGGSIIVQIDPWLVQAGIGTFILWSVFGTFPPIAGRHVLLGGIVSSFLTMFFGATGSFVSSMVKSMQLPPLAHVATHSTLMTAQHLLKVLAFGILGFAYGPYALLITLMIISGFIGTVIGKQVLMRLDQALFKRLLNITLTLLALRLFWSALEGYLGHPLF